MMKNLAVITAIVAVVLVVIVSTAGSTNPHTSGTFANGAYGSVVPTNADGSEFTTVLGPGVTVTWAGFPYGYCIHVSFAPKTIADANEGSGAYIPGTNGPPIFGPGGFCEGAQGYITSGGLGSPVYFQVYG